MNLSYMINPLSLNDTRQMIKFRLHQAGVDGDTLFSGLLHQSTGSSGVFSKGQGSGEIVIGGVVRVTGAPGHPCGLWPRP